MHALPLGDQVRSAAILQIVSRLGIPLGIGLTTVIWASLDPSLKDAATTLDNNSLAATQRAYSSVFVATLCFSTGALLASPFACVGKLGIASTASDPSIPHISSDLEDANKDGPGDAYPDGRRVRAPLALKRISQLIQPRSSSLANASFKNAWRRSSAANSSFHLPLIPASGASGDGCDLELGLGLTSYDGQKSQRTSMAMAERVIWLVCEDCGASKRIVEPVGDPERYFYDGDICDRESGNSGSGTEASKQSGAPFSAGSEYHKSSADGDVPVNPRRFALVKS